MTFYTIPPTSPFAQSLAKHCEDVAQSHDIPLSDIKIFLPTRRAIRTLQQAFLQLSNGKPRLLPIMQSIGDADLEEAQFSHGADDGTILPAISPLRRQMILARMIHTAFEDLYDYNQSLIIGGDLGRLIDQIHTQNLSINDLPNIMQEADYAQYWQITTSFLIQILGDLWPKYLQDHGMIDGGLHRVKRIQSLTKFYQAHALSKPVIVAGSTGSLPATRDFIKAVARLDNGQIILPALDTVMDDSAWHNVGEGHPQDLLKRLLSECRIERQNVRTIGNHNNQNRFFLMSEMMRPAETSDKWQALSLNDQQEKIQNGVQNITLCHADHDHHEASVIALAMAEIANDEAQEKTCVFITPDRFLAMRVQGILKQWGINIDDSGGTSLPNTSIGHFAMNVIGAVSANAIHPIQFLSAIKSHHAGGGTYSDAYRSDIRKMEKRLFRGLRPEGLLNDLAIQHEKHAPILNHLHDIFKPIIDIGEGVHDLKTLITAHVSTMENLAQTHDLSGASRLWVGDAGECLASFFANLMAQNDIAMPMTISDYSDFIASLLTLESYTATYGKHPRLAILGQIESRMVMADRVILGGLNEGTWPPESGFDAWMSRPMRARYGLPSLEQKTTLAGHDFACGFCAKDVFITRSQKSNGQPTQASQWIQRLRTVLLAANIPRDQWPNIRGDVYCDWARQLRHANDVQPFNRPEPRPSLSRRPTEFSATEIEKWMRDPYVMYAKKILRLKRLDQVDRAMSVADRGTLIHNVMEEYMHTYRAQTQLPQTALNDLLAIGRKHFDNFTTNTEIHGMWWPRFEKTAMWFIDQDRDWRPYSQSIHVEQKGMMKIGDFTLSAKADRIDMRMGGDVAVIDYKTGAPPSAGEVNAGIASQLPLEAVILSQGGFDFFQSSAHENYDLQYWNLSGSGAGGEVTPAQGKSVNDTDPLIEQALSGVSALFKTFHDEKIPYLGSPDSSIMIKNDYNDYAHLERISEWSVEADGEDFHD